MHLPKNFFRKACNILLSSRVVEWSLWDFWQNSFRKDTKVDVKDVLRHINNEFPPVFEAERTVHVTLISRSQQVPYLKGFQKMLLKKPLEKWKVSEELSGLNYLIAKAKSLKIHFGALQKEPEYTLKSKTYFVLSYGVKATAR